MATVIPFRRLTEIPESVNAAVVSLNARWTVTAEQTEAGMPYVVVFESRHLDPLFAYHRAPDGRYNVEGLNGEVLARNLSESALLGWARHVA